MIEMDTRDTTTLTMVPSLGVSWVTTADMTAQARLSREANRRRDGEDDECERMCVRSSSSQQPFDLNARAWYM